MRLGEGMEGFALQALYLCDSAWETYSTVVSAVATATEP
jgi:hypothetical protein